MDVQSLVNEIKIFYDLFLEFIDCEDENKEKSFDGLINFIETQKEFESKAYLHEVMIIINKISKNHHRNCDFIGKIEQIIQYFHTPIKQNYTNYEIFDFFKHNKRVLLFLFQQKIINIDEDILQKILKIKDYQLYFFNEIKNSISNNKKKSIEQELLKIDENIFDNFDQKCKIGENDSYICTLIRHDFVEDFIAYVNRYQIKLSSKINESIFETNNLLLKQKPTLIEYASFFGSIQIIQYLVYNSIQLTKSLWIYTIHSKNAELIHFLEEKQIEKTNEFYEKCLKESIKCHHNEIANYINENLIFHEIKNEERSLNVVIDFFKKILNQKKDNSCYDSLDNQIIKTGFSFHNYNYIGLDVNNTILFSYFCQFDYFYLVKFFIEKKIVKINDKLDEITLHIAAERNNFEIVDYLLSFQHIKINPTDFEKCKLRKISLPSSFKSKEIISFKYCSSLAEFVLPPSITTIIDEAFYECSSLKQIKIPSLVTKIGCKAFCGCSLLEKVEIPNSVSIIESSAFKNCSSLKQITIPPLVTTINDNVFLECTSLEQITIPSSVTSIGNNAFQNCVSLTQIEDLSSITTIGESAFSGCSSLTQMPLSYFVTSIGKGAFSSCSSLTQFIIYHSITTIEEDTFYNCSSLEQIFILSPVTSIKNRAFANCSSLTHISNCSSVISIGEFAFSNCSNLCDIQISPFYEEIGICAFENCISLEKISSPSLNKSTANFSSITGKNIGSYAFKGCISLNQISIPSSIYWIEDNAFEGCNSLTQITIPSSVISLGDFVFKKCSSLKLISINSYLSSFRNDVFSECSSFIQVNLNSNKFNIEYITANTFRDCSTITQVIMPSSILTIEDSAFRGCISIRQIILPQSLKYIRSKAFLKCNSLTEISIPSSVVSIDDNAFFGCSSLKTISIPSSVEYIGKFCFYGCSSLTQISIPTSIYSIQKYTFSYCQNLTKIDIPSNVKYIEEYAFSYCSSLNEISKVSSTIIHFDAFYGCSSISKTSLI